MLENFLNLIESRKAKIGLVGLGYVGLPVALSFGESGFTVFGVDLDREKIEALENGRSYIKDIPDDRVAALRKSGRLRASTNARRLKDADAVLISVPTPLTDGAPDLRGVVSAGRSVAKVLKPGSLVILESTTYPGTTEELLKPILEESGLVAGKDFMLAYSPERIDPANQTFAFGDIPKVVGGMDEAATEAAAALYGQVVPKVVQVSGTREAEMTKLLENTFRHVNIALVNELAVYANDMGIDIWEVIEAAATKPFGYLPFWPGPGWGGHCIPLDPSYLSYRVRRDRSHEVRFVELAQAINSEMPRHVIERTGSLLNDTGKAIRGARILGVGVSYKAGTPDTRESAGLKVLESLHKRGAKIAYHDPLVSDVTVNEETLKSVPLTKKTLTSQDLVIVLVPQIEVDWDTIATHSRLVFDCCNALHRKTANIVRL